MGRKQKKVAEKSPGMFYDFEVYNLSALNARVEFNIDPRYFSLSAIGKGTYGVVASALDLNTGKRVAIKKISSMELPLMALRTLREIRILRFLDHENIISINEVSARNSYNEIYIVQPLIKNDLHQAMFLRDFNHNETAYITYQLFRGLKYLHSASIIHRDIKPSNILIDKDSTIKICDFGLARVFNDAEEKDNHGMTEYVATRWYRAPEIMMAARCYDKAIDVWSAGCVLAELMSRASQRVLFPGRHYLHMLQLMIELLGTPTEQDLSYVVNPKAREFIMAQRKAKRINWQEKFSFGSPEACDLLDKIMNFHPRARITVNEALKHPLLVNFPEVPDYNFPEPLLFEENFYDLKANETRKLIAKEAELIELKHRRRASA